MLSHPSKIIWYSIWSSCCLNSRLYISCSSWRARKQINLRNLTRSLLNEKIKRIWKFALRCSLIHDFLMNFRITWNQAIVKFLVRVLLSYFCWLIKIIIFIYSSKVCFSSIEVSQTLKILFKLSLRFLWWNVRYINYT